MTFMEPRYTEVICELTGVQDLDADFVGFGRRDLDLLDLEELAGSPADGGLALDRLSCGVRHGGGTKKTKGG